MTDNTAKVADFPDSPDKLVNNLLEADDRPVALSKFIKVLKRGGSMLATVAEEYMHLVEKRPDRLSVRDNDPDVAQAAKLEAQARRLRRQAERRAQEQATDAAKATGRARYVAARDAIAGMRFGKRNILDLTFREVQSMGGWFDEIVHSAPQAAKLDDKLGKHFTLDQLAKLHGAPEG